MATMVGITDEVGAIIIVVLVINLVVAIKVEWVAAWAVNSPAEVWAVNSPAEVWAVNNPVADRVVAKAAGRTCSTTCTCAA